MDFVLALSKNIENLDTLFTVTDKFIKRVLLILKNLRKILKTGRLLYLTIYKNAIKICHRLLFLTKTLNL